MQKRWTLNIRPTADAVFSLTPSNFGAFLEAIVGFEIIELVASRGYLDRLFAPLVLSKPLPPPFRGDASTKPSPRFARFRGRCVRIAVR